MFPLMQFSIFSKNNIYFGSIHVKLDQLILTAVV